METTLSEPSYIVAYRLAQGPSYSEHARICSIRRLTKSGLQAHDGAWATVEQYTSVARRLQGAAPNRF